MPLSQTDARSTGQIVGRLYYFDVFGGAVAVAIIARCLAAAVDPSWSWNTARLLAITLFGVTLTGLIAFRLHAYRRESPWLALSFSAAAVVALFALFWPLNVLLFALAMAAGCAALAFALIMRTRTISEPVSRDDEFRLAALLIGAALALAVVEAGLRVAPGILSPELRQIVNADPTQYGVPDPYIGYLHRPNGATVVEGRDFKAVHKVDDKGFRNSSPWPTKADIVVVGDSVAFGYGVAGEQAWPAIVGSALGNMSLVNLALIGAGPQQYLRLYETFGVGLKPRLLIVGVFVRNDFWDAEMFDLWLKSGAHGNFLVWRDFGRPRPVTLSLTKPTESLRSIFDDYAYPVLRTSRIYNLLRGLHGGGAGDVGPATYFTVRDGTRLHLYPDDFRIQSARAANNTHAFGLAMNAFEELHMLAAKNGTRVLMLLQPCKEEVYLPLLRKDVPDPARALREAFGARGIEYLDLGPAFRERAAAGDRLFFEQDGHPNPSGYALIARLVVSHLNRMAREYSLDDRAGVLNSTPHRWPGVASPASDR